MRKGSELYNSPPYFNLRSYLPNEHPRKSLEIGSEPTVEAHIEKMVQVFREVRRVLRPEGTLWLNYGDCYCNFDKWGGGGGNSGKQTKHGDSVPSWAVRRRKHANKESEFGLKPKDLMMLPSRIAIALQADGWWLRSALPWLKPNGMPSSVEDRPGTSVEWVFMFTKSPRYYYDGEAIKLQAKYPAGPNAPDKVKSPQGQGFARKNAEVSADRKALVNQTYARHRKAIDGGQTLQEQPDGQRSFRQSDAFFSAVGDVKGVVSNSGGDILALHVATQPYPDAHFATFPPKLIEPLILSGTSAKGCCSACGSPWERIVEKTFVPQPDVSLQKGVRGAHGQKPMDESDSREGFPRGATTSRTVGWRPTCECFVDDKGAVPPPVVPCTVLDPFMGAGTTGLVADRLGRSAIGFELSEEYAGQAETRVAADRGGDRAGWLFDMPSEVA